MRIRHSQFKPLARHIVQHLNRRKLASFEKQEGILEDFIVELFQKNAEEEARLDEEARRLLEQNRKKIGLNIDEERALAMIKKQLAKERNFIL